MPKTYPHMIQASAVQAPNLASDRPTMIQAAAETPNLTTDGLTAIAGVAYSGGPLTQWWSDYPIYVDLAGLAIRAQIPLLYNHYNSPASRLGVLQAVIVDGRLTVTGGIDPNAQGAKDLIAAGKKIPWQLSIGASFDRLQEVKKDETVTVNGRSITGPAFIVATATLSETSLVAVGADAETYLNILASLNPQPKGVATMPTTATNLPPATEPTPTAPPAAGNIQAAAAAAPPATPPNATVIEAAAIQAERARITEVDQICVRHPDIAAKARNEGWDVNRARTEVLNAINASYTTPPAPHVQVANQDVDQKTLMAAAFQAIGVPSTRIEATQGKQALDAADRRWHGNISLQELILEAAAANGHASPTHRLTGGNWFDVTARAIQASGASSINLPGLLGGIVSRALEDGFSVVDDSWRQIAAERTVKDFRAITSYRMATAGGFDKVGPTGELKHGSISESSWTNKAETYGKMLGITRQDIINDDLGALASVPQQLGLDAALTLNRVFWAEFMDNAAFFSDANGNLVPNNPLAVEGLSVALKAFRALKDESGRLMGMTPAILLVPSALEVPAGQLFRDQAIIAIGMGSVAKTLTSGNPHIGKYTPVVSPYLDDATLTGNSSTAYYLLAKPAFMASIQIAFLNGVKVPTIQSSEMEFSNLGMQFRAYFDFGVKKKDPAAGIKVQGNA